jgi:hypothetical protein
MKLKQKIQIAKDCQLNIIKMQTEYYLKYGSKINQLNILVNYFDKKYDFFFEERESSYIGEYYLYKGLYADKIVLEYNYNKIEKKIKEDMFKELPIIISITIANGKNIDKKSRCKYLKKLLNADEYFVFISENIIET